MKTVNLYLMTNITSIKPANGQYVFIFEMERDPEPVTLTVPGTVEGETRNSAEILILQKALSRLKPCDLTIHTENSYLASALEMWLDKWQQNEFKDTKGEDIKFKDRWENISQMLKDIPYTTRLREEHQYKQWMREECERRKHGSK